MSFNLRSGGPGALGRAGSTSNRRLASLILSTVILGVAVALLVGNVRLIEAHGAEDFLIYRRHDGMAGGRLAV